MFIVQSIKTDGHVIRTQLSAPCLFFCYFSPTLCAMFSVDDIFTTSAALWGARRRLFTRHAAGRPRGPMNLKLSPWARLIAFSTLLSLLLPSFSAPVARAQAEQFFV